MKHLRLLKELVVASTLVLSFNSLACPDDVQDFFQREGLRSQAALPQQQHRADRFRLAEYNDGPLPPYTGRVSAAEVPFDSRHTVFGHMDNSNGSGRITKGLHSRYGLDQLMESNPAVRARLLDADGNIDHRYIDVDPETGVQTILIPRDGFHKFNGHWRSARDRGGSIRMNGEEGQEFVAKNLFPQSWNPEDIEAAARAVYRQHFDGSTPLVNGTYSGIYQGVPVDIQVGNNNINSVFPSWEGAFPEYETFRVRKPNT